MAFLRVNVAGRVNKPLPISGAKLTALQTAIADVKTYCQRINQGKANEEYSIRTDYDNQAGWIDFKIDLSIPENLAGTLVMSSLDEQGNPVGGIKIASVVVPKLDDLRAKIRDFKQYLTSNESGRIVTEVFICNHDSNGILPDGERLEI